MALNDEELERYARHIILKEVGGPGQQKLKAAKVLVIGAGGLGSPALMYLAAAGVGTLGVVDDDEVSLSNLQRQIVHATDRVGMAKPESAAVMLKGINPHVEVVQHTMRLTTGNALELVSGYDLVADGCDNFDTRYVVSDACYFARKPLVSAAVGQFDGQITTFKPHETQEDGTPYPTYRCLLPEAPPPGAVPTCEEAGVLGALTGIIGSLQAIEVIKEILGIGESLAGRLMLYDALSARFQQFTLPWDPNNALTGENPTIASPGAKD
ncbi:MAG: HesA/MoeB/ThiF family protein [Hyphomicrobiales bacterium]